MKFEILKGTKDYLPKEQIRINFIISIIQKNFENFGFKAFDSPIIEYLSTLVGKYDKDDEIVNEIFTLSDRGKRELGLRYDLTTPLCRFISSQKQLILPFRRYQIGKVFRDGPIKKGRLREFLQCDGDVIGISGQEIEAELLNIFYKTYNDLKIKSIIEINNNKILRGAFLQEGFNKKDLSSLILSIDKLKKIGRKKVLEEIKKKGLDEKKAKRAINILELDNFKEILDKTCNNLLKNGINELLELSKILDKLKINYRINFSLSRGLDIYSGNIWEVYDETKKITSSIGGGGRYDNVISEFSKGENNFSSVGISFGIIPILEIIEFSNKETPTDILIVPLNKELFIKSLNISKYLQKDKINTEIYYEYKLKKAFNYANKNKIEKLIIVGEKDLKNQFTLKNLKTGENITKTIL